MVTPQDLRIVILGAGMSGLLAGAQLSRRGDRNWMIYEKSDRVGGTWRDNTYPGLTCDTPSHHYTFRFRRNPDWSHYLPPGAEIQQYFESVTDEFDLRSHIRFNQEATSAEWRDGRWHLQFASGLTDTADVLIAATGVLRVPKEPNFPGRDQFRGAVFHSSRWNHRCVLDGARIGVIGNGSTGVQIVTALADRAASLVHFQRHAQWMMPVDNIPYTEAQRRSFRDPAVLAAEMNFEQFNQLVDVYIQAIIDPQSQSAQHMAAACLQNLEENVQDPVLREQLRPDHTPLCYRLIFSSGYYPAIQRPSSHLETAGIVGFEPEGIRTVDGTLHELDIVVFATGFDPSAFMRPMQLRGRNGIDIDTVWKRAPKAYLAVSVPDFPNFFMLNGPNGPVGNFSLTAIAEHQWDYIAQLIDLIKQGLMSEVSVKHEVMLAYENERTEAAKKTVWYNGGCHSWYLNAEGIPASWPWSYHEFVARMNAPNMAHFDCR